MYTNKGELNHNIINKLELNSVTWRWEEPTSVDTFMWQTLPNHWKQVES